MDNIVLIAPPAAGKGTVSKYLVDTFGYVQISAGKLLREKSIDNERLRETLDAGELVNDEIIFEALEAKLNKLGNTPYILDGFPRTVNQAVMYDGLLKRMGKTLGVVIYLDVDKEELKKRVIARRVCPKCRFSYSTINKDLFPKEKGICDNCKFKLVQREEDNEEVFDRRYEDYLEKTLPLVDYYESKGVLVKISYTDVNEIFKKLFSLVRNV